MYTWHRRHRSPCPGRTWLALLLVAGAAATGCALVPATEALPEIPPGTRGGLRLAPQDWQDPIEYEGLEAEPYEEPEAGYPAPAQPSRAGVSGEIAVGAFVSAPYGIALESDFGLDEVDYADIFDPGFGVNVHGRLHFFLPRPPGRDLSIGPALLFDTVTYPGESHEIAPDVFLEPDDMRIVRFLPAFFVRATFGAFFVGGHFGLGIARIDSVDAVEEDRFAGTRIQGEIFAATTTVALEFAGRIGGRFLLGDAAAMSIFGFLGFGSTGAPEEGDELSPTAETGAAGHAFLGFGMSTEFGSLGAPVRPLDPYDERW